MKALITAFTFFICSLLNAQTQFEQGMGKAMGLWKEGKTEEASALFERIASAEKTNWLPNYYVGMVNVTAAFNPANKDKAPALLDKAQTAVDNASVISPNNPEIIVLQALLYTAWLVQDPMTNGMKYSGKVMEEYYKALALAPENPRAVFGKADFEINGAKWTGADVKKLCKEVERSIDLFAKFKPEGPFYPNWGLERAQETLKNCK
ncbi:tetratricopeptide repeat protein [Flavobacterium sp.]|uniref:tetratricopeptide repeat protein n=1 Tax=Flavobacterium sp. TaxID=239 RepID=UPI002FDB4618